MPVGAARAAPEVHPTTRANAMRAMHGEAFAHASYLAYAQQATRTRETKAERAFVTAGRAELSDHFTAHAALIGFVGSNAANLRDAIAGEHYESTTMYPSFARQARRDGCTAAANLFTEIAPRRGDPPRLVPDRAAGGDQPEFGSARPDRGEGPRGAHPGRTAQVLRAHAE
ncbi:MAG: ferritin family protein, partial [Mycobacterium leprae]